MFRDVKGAGALVSKYYLEWPPRRGERPGRLGGAGTLGTLVCRGSNRLLADRAGVLGTPWSFLTRAGANGHRANGPASGIREVPASLPENEAAVLSGVGFGPTEVYAISHRSGLETPKVLSALALLELNGYVSRDSGGAYSRRATL